MWSFGVVSSRSCALVSVWPRGVMVTGLLLCCVLAGAEGVKEFEPPQDMVFRAEIDGSDQRYVLMLPRGMDAGKPHPLLIALHGHGSDRWQFVKDERGECQGAREVALKHGAIYVSPDYRAKTSWMGPLAEADLVQVIADLKKRYPIERVLLCGGSMGGSSALTFAALHPELIDGVVALNGTANHLEYENFQEAIAESFGGTKEMVPDEYRKRSAEYWPERFRMPVAISTGGKDTLVPCGSAVRLAGAIRKLQPDVLLIHHPEGGHATNLEDTISCLEFVFERSSVK